MADHSEPIISRGVPVLSLQLLQEYLSIEGALQVNLLLTLLIILGVIALRALVLRFITRRDIDRRAQYRWRKVTSYVAVAVALLLIVPLWLPRLGSLATVLGLLTAGIAIALRDPLTDLGGWLFIVTRRPFDVGDRIEIAGRIGDVIDVRLFQFSMLEVGNWVEADQSTGRIVHVPNKLIFSDMLANYTSQFDYIWHEIAVFITLDSDWQAAKRLCEEILERHVGPIAVEARATIDAAAQHSFITYANLTPTIYTRVHPHAVRLTLRYLTPSRRRRGLEHLIWEDILSAFAEHDDIVFAPSQRISLVEGSTGLVAQPAEPAPPTQR